MHPWFVLLDRLLDLFAPCYSQSPSDFVHLYKENGLEGGHIIKLGPRNDSAAKEALAAWPGKLLMGQILEHFRASIRLVSGSIPRKEDFRLVVASTMKMLKNGSKPGLAKLALPLHPSAHMPDMCQDHCDFLSFSRRQVFPRSFTIHLVDGRKGEAGG